MFLVDFLKGIGKGLAKTFGIIKKVVPEEQLLHGIDLVKQAADKFVDNKQKRDWVIDQFMKKFPVSEGIARLVVEIAVQHLKHDVMDVVVEKAKDEVKD